MSEEVAEPSWPAELTLTTWPPANGGSCVARHEGRVVFVRYALPGETVKVRVVAEGLDAQLDLTHVHEPLRHPLTLPQVVVRMVSRRRWRASSTTGPRPAGPGDGHRTPACWARELPVVEEGR